ncbi:hypothetical protein ACH474_18810 [Nocardia rhamnosiphila]|uniref:hypothetical protein n=1 Tax=Nocardia rhamnosiphila TaxID=426716 RepID=UPI00378A6C23
MVIEIGDKVRIGESGASTFVVRDIDHEEARATIEPDNPQAAGGYSFSMPLAALVAVEAQE